MDNIGKVVDYINVQRDRYVDELKQYLAIPSISALPEHQPDVRRAAEWSADHMKNIASRTSAVRTPGNRRVQGRRKEPGAPTILYGHTTCSSGSDSPSGNHRRSKRVRENEIYARSAADDGAGLHALQGHRAHMKAVAYADQHQVLSRRRESAACPRSSCQTKLSWRASS